MWEKCRRFAITISTHTPAWSVTFFAACTAFCASISTHTPAWGVTISSTPTEQTVLNFNSHARVGRDCHFVKQNASQGISTHTPAWGVTVLFAHLAPLNQISTHTPAWGVTNADHAPVIFIFYFNSHARVGRDL